MTGAVIQALWSHWRRNLLQLVALVAGLALATALWSGVQAINAEARSSYDAAASTLGEGEYDQLLPRSGETIEQSRYVALRRAGWQVSPVVEGRIGPPGDTVRLVGIEPLTAPQGLNPLQRQSESVGLDEFLGEPVIFAAPETAAKLLGLIAARVIEDTSIAPGLALTDIGFAQAELGLVGTISRMVVLRAQSTALSELDMLAPELVRQPASGGSDVGRLTDSFHLNLTAFGLLSFAVGIFIVHGTISLAFEQRRAMIRTQRVLGVPLPRLVVLLAAEILVIAVVSGAIGVGLGYMIAAALLPDVAATLRGLYGADVAGTLQLRPSWWISGLAISVLGASIAAGAALWRTASMPLLPRAQPRAITLASDRTARWLFAGAFVLLVSAASLSQWGQGLVMGFIMLGALLVGVALLLPLFLTAAVRLFRRAARRPLAQWFWADTQQQVPGMSLALMALLLASATNIGVTTMVSSFRATFVGFLDQRLAPELFVQLDDAAQGPSLERFVAPYTWEVLPIAFADTRLAGVPSELYGARVGQTYRDNWVLLDQDIDAWDDVAAGTGVVVSEQLARRANVWRGDKLFLPDGRDMQIVGVVADYGNPRGQAVVSETVFAALFPNMPPRRFGLRSDQTETLRTALVEDFGLSEGNLIDQAAIKSFSLQVFERTFTVTGALNVLTLAVAGFAILMSLLTLADMRLPQLAPVWALGQTRRSLGWLELLRACVLAVLTACLALPLGLVLAWVLLAVVNVEAFGWRLPMFLFPSFYVAMIGFALVAAVLAAGWPAWKLSRAAPADLLRVFASDR
ncbi:MAG: FtsX-like permease family protein [Pseudomonadota bacterium]